MGHILGKMILPRFDEFMESVEDCQVKLGSPFHQTSSRACPETLNHIIYGINLKGQPLSDNNYGLVIFVQRVTSISC